MTETINGKEITAQNKLSVSLWENCLSVHHFVYDPHNFYGMSFRSPEIARNVRDSIIALDNAGMNDQGMTHVLRCIVKFVPHPIEIGDMF